MDDVLIIIPLSPSLLISSALDIPEADWLATKKLPNKLTEMTFENNSLSWASPLETVFIAGAMPAQFIHILSCPKILRASIKPFLMLSGLVTSTFLKKPLIFFACFLPLSSLLSNKVTLTFLLDRISETAAPSPEAPPVITAEIFLESFIIINQLLILVD